MAGSKLSKRSHWRWAAASMIGTSHKQVGAECQDTFAVARLDYNSRLRASNRFAKECVVAIVSDGAGSARYGKIGAQTASMILLDRASRGVDGWMTRKGVLRESPRVPKRNHVERWIDDSRKVIGRIAMRNQVKGREYASTVAGIVVTPDGFSAWQIGDCAIVGRRNNSWEVVCWPDQGEYVSETYFLTDEPCVRMNFSTSTSKDSGGRYDAFALFSDGLNNVALDLRSKTASRGFFCPMLRPVDSSRISGKLQSLSGELENFLDSRKVCERTDDDKTIVLLSRR